MQNTRAEFDFTPKNLVYWILIGACVIVIWLIIQGTIKKVLSI